MNPKNILPRRKFITLTACGIGGAVMARAAVPSAQDPRFVSLKEAHQGTLEIDLRIMNQFKEQPRSVQDFYAAGRAALTGPDPEAAIAEVCRAAGRRTIGGPMLGDLTATGVAVWMHLPEADKVDVVVTRKGRSASKVFKSAAAERIQSVRCEGLLPNTRYAYVVRDSKGRELGSGSFATAPAELSEDPFQIAFGTCFHKVGLHRPELMKLVQERGSKAMLVLGDSAVDDRKCDWGLINADYLLRNLSPVWQQLAANVPVFTSWDDHDYWHDDSSGTFSRGQSIDVDGLRKIWKRQWNNPDREARRKGVYFKTRMGPVDFICLDTRSCRLYEERGKLNSYLGAEQMAWAKQQIEESTAPFILLSSGTMWSDYISNGKDSWGTWDTEGREEIFQVIDAKKGSKVVLLSGDRHGARGFAIPRPGGKKIYEFEVATLGGVPGPEAFGEDRSAQLFGLPSRSWAFSEFAFREVGGVPQATFRLVNERGEVLETIALE
ncbi:alkaline phosphatase D family protein [Pelagicoccus sp. SDUM812005]|uniref:alkaline phosphatase D family protein n=1 Tax=Pelagicoccus sp. SDUM812005 TaxID=3041257 RepID=UPI00280E58CA|nr:alkaline phosphatase D family protein [Pelagicoccus sp. SDUM812005]MDQ8183301.1 alkaline phosphatase D family protein [Pelagicoccus sp. SDUM812005]